MMKKLLLATSVSALMLSGALAQAPSPSQPPASSPPAATPAPSDQAKPEEAQQNQAKPDQAQQNQAKPDQAGTQAFVASQSPDQMVFSKFEGTDVVGPDNKKIGDVSDVLFDKEHKILAVIVGVGGFLGVGEKRVAIEPSALQPWRDPESKSTDPQDMKLKVNWTKDQLANAPAFAYYEPPKQSASSPSGGTTGMSPGNRSGSTGR